MEITTIPSPILNRKLSDVSLERVKSGELNDLIEEMKKTMAANEGIGLAANQIGQDLSIFVIDPKLAEDGGIPEVFINPEITEYSKDLDELEEGCLSIPKFFVPVKRPKKIKIKALDQNGNKIKFKVRGFLARVLQHETDHLNGLTIKDRI